MNIEDVVSGQEYFVFGKTEPLKVKATTKNEVTVHCNFVENDDWDYFYPSELHETAEACWEAEELRLRSIIKKAVIELSKHLLSKAQWVLKQGNNNDRTSDSVAVHDDTVGDSAKLGNR